MAIITVSRQLGSLGDEIAQNVANDLGYEYVNKTKIGEAFAIQGVPHIEIEKYDESNGEMILRRSDRESSGYIRSFFNKHFVSICLDNIVR